MSGNSEIPKRMATKGLLLRVEEGLELRRLPEKLCGHLGTA